MKCLTLPVSKHESLFARILEIMYINDFFLSVNYNILLLILYLMVQERSKEDNTWPHKYLVRISLTNKWAAK